MDTLKENKRSKIHVKIKYSVCLQLNRKVRKFVREAYGVWGIRTNQQLKELYRTTDLAAETIGTRLERL
jgi:hypothetical protein